MVKDRAEVTVRMTKKEYELMKSVVEAARKGLAFNRSADACSKVLDSAEFNPLLHPNVSIGSSFKRGNG